MLENNLQKGIAIPAIFGIIALVITVGGTFYYATKNEEAAKTDETMMKKEDGAMMEPGDEGAMGEKDDAMMDEGPEPAGGSMMRKGSYEAYDPEKLSLALNGKVLLFFHADWCPICRGIESEINANPAAIPDGVHILKINYDTAASLRRKYGVTVQHTFVQVDAAGNAIAKWNDTTALSGVLSRVE